MRTDRPMCGMSGIVGRCLWRSVAALLVFAQVAVAADQCPPVRSVGERAVLTLAVVDDHHGLDAHCVSDLVAPDQAPASEAKRLAPDLGVSTPVAWDLALGPSPRPVVAAYARAGPSLRLQFGNLRL